MSNEAKLIRKQVRNVVNEILGEVLTAELVKAIERQILDDVNKQLKLLHKHVEDSLKLMDKKVSDGVSYLVRHSADTPMKLKVDKE